MADLAGLSSLSLRSKSTPSLKAGDFDGLTGLTFLNLAANQLDSLPQGVFSDLTNLESLDMQRNEIASLRADAFSGLSKLTLISLIGNDLSSLPEDVFSGLSSLTTLRLSSNKLTALPADLFDGLSALDTLQLGHNELTSLDADLFDGLSALKDLFLNGNDLDTLPADLFDGLAALEDLSLQGNDLTALPDGLFSGLTALVILALDDNPDTDDTLALTVAVEKVGTDQVRAKVLTGAPFAVDFTPTVVNGSLPASDTKLAVAAGSVDGTAETVTRTSGTTAAVTVDIDLTTQPSLPTNHSGYTFEKATGSEPAIILPDTRGPQNLTAAPGDGQVTLSWDAPPTGSGVTKHQYRFKTTGNYIDDWEDIPNSAEDAANEAGYTVTGLTNEVAHTFQLRRYVGTTASATAESNAVTPTPGICDRTQGVQDGILAAVFGADACNEVTVADLAGIGYLEFSDAGITSLKSGDFAGLTGVEEFVLKGNPRSPRFHRGCSPILRALFELNLRENELQSLPVDVFFGLTAMGSLDLRGNAQERLPAGVFSDPDVADRDLSGGQRPDHAPRRGVRRPDGAGQTRTGRQRRRPAAADGDGGEGGGGTGYGRRCWPGRRSWWTSR